jgi:hypothetical protein
MVFQLSFRATGSFAAGPSPWHRASIPLELRVEAGKRYRLYLDVKEHPYVTFKIVDLDRPDAAWVSLTTPTVRLLTGLSTVPSPQSIQFHARP